MDVTMYYGMSQVDFFVAVMLYTCLILIIVLSVVSFFAPDGGVELKRVCLAILIYPFKLVSMLLGLIYTPKSIVINKIKKRYSPYTYKCAYNILNNGTDGEAYEIYMYFGVVNDNVLLQDLSGEEFTIGVREFFNDFKHISCLKYDTCFNSTRACIKSDFDAFCRIQDERRNVQ